jgi:hypothetical protein
MSKINLEKALRRELELINDIIDQKIVRGLPYGREARRHKFLLSNIAKIQQYPKIQTNWFFKPLSLVSSFLL